MTLIKFALCCALAAALPVAASEYPVHYTVTLLPEKNGAEVVIAIPDATQLRELDFNLSKRHSGIAANGQLTLEEGRALWIPPRHNARLSLQVNLIHERDPGEFDSYITDDWAIFRGDDLIPPARVRSLRGAESKAVLEFRLPPDWSSVNTGWPVTAPSESRQVFTIENPERRFDRPTGWMVAGKLGTRREQFDDSRLAVSGPLGEGLRRMEVVAFVSMIWPEAEQAFGEMPPKLLLVGAGDPMWRGGLSAPNSLFIHAERPLVSENGTSALVHELVHMITGIVGEPQHDWIAEGLTEFYAVELLYRAGALTDERRNKVFNDLAKWGQDVKTLIQPRSTGRITARATVLMHELDQELRERSEHTIDAVTRRLMDEDKASLADLQAICQELLNGECKTLDTPLLTTAKEPGAKEPAPTEPAQSTESSQSRGSDQPRESSQSTESHQSLRTSPGSSQSSAPGQPDESSQPEESSQPAESEPSVESNQPEG